MNKIINKRRGDNMGKINIEDLYWEDWDELSKNKDEIDRIFHYLKDFEAREIDELAHILTLYNNPSGAYTVEFANIIADLYRYSKIKFIKALGIVKDESINLVYVFRNLKVFTDEDEELKEILGIEELSQGDKEVAKDFFQMYKNICAS